MKTYNAGEYIRISRKDGDKLESDSIGNQRDFLDAYIEKNDDLMLVDRYIDDDYTGTNFERPDFQRMMEDVNQGRINCIIVKDLSRFGRDYIDVGNYLQKIFPKLGVRFIAINDNVDSGVQQYDMMMPMKNLFNEQYARDISMKVLTAMRTKQAAGQFIGAFACYGYVKDPHRKGKIIIDDYAASIVKRIYDLYLGGTGQITIAKILNEDKILCPSAYKNSQGMRYNNSKRLEKTNYWTYATIHKILTSEIYTGKMVQHRNNASQYRNGSSRTVDKSEWCIVEGTHDAIISEEQWNQVQSLMSHKTKDYKLLNQNINVYAGFLTCADCGRGLSLIRGKRNRYVCATYKQFSRSFCTAHRLFEDELNQVILHLANEKIKQIKKIAILIDEEEAKKNKSVSISKNNERIHKLDSDIQRIEFLKRGLYEDYRSGILDIQEYKTYKTEYQKQSDELCNQLEHMKRLQEGGLEAAKANPYIVRFRDSGELTEITKEILDVMFEYIKVHEGNRLDVGYRFKEESVLF